MLIISDMDGVVEMDDLLQIWHGSFTAHIVAIAEAHVIGGLLESFVSK